MNIYKQSQFDILRILTTPWTYLGMFIILFNLTIIIISLNTFNTISSEKILRIVTWFIVCLGMIIVIRTITRDVQYKTLQIIFNNSAQRYQYFFSKTLSIFGIIIFIYFLTILYTFVFSIFTSEFSLSFETLIESFTVIFLFLFLYFLLIYGITLTLKITIIPYVLGILAILFLPMSFVYIRLIPNLGEFLMTIFDYIPFAFLPDKIYNGEFSLNFNQFTITAITILILILVNLFISKKTNV
ncbi:hypothetical protein [Staphylococcus gallinarum]|uniref:hypothetical protein n=1 Tax=Staphylococcus gallinarum TaxID=1293 RepID=UPI0030C35731